MLEFDIRRVCAFPLTEKVILFSDSCQKANIIEIFSRTDLDKCESDKL